MSAAAPPSESATIANARIVMWKPVLLVALGVITLGLCYLTRPIATKPVPGVTMNLPNYVGFWVGHKTDVSQAELDILPDDTEFARKIYEGPGTKGLEPEILCSIVLSGADARSIHRPERCLPGQSFNIGQSTTMPVTLDDGRELKVQVLDLTRQVKVAENDTRIFQDLYVYWFVGDRMTTHSNLERTVRGFADRVLYNQQHRWAYCIVSAPVTGSRYPNGLNREQTWELLEGFIRVMAPEMLTPETLKSLPLTEPAGE